MHKTRVLGFVCSEECNVINEFRISASYVLRFSDL